MSLIKNSLWNLSGLAIPSLLAIPSIGFIARRLGIEAFGIFTIAFAFIGYASMFDVGISRAAIRLVSRTRQDRPGLIRIIATSTAAVMLLSLVAMAALFFSTPAICHFLRISPEHLGNTISAIRLLCIAIPFFLLTQVWTAYLEGMELFSELNIQKTLAGVVMALLPAFMLIVGSGLYYAILGILFSRIIAALISYLFCKRHIPISLKLDRATLRELLSFGGWLTISNIISPIMVYIDRFVLSNALGAKNVAFYSSASEAVTRLLIIPASIAKALFPRLSFDNKVQQPGPFWKNYHFVLFCICLSISLPIFALSGFIMKIWMGEAYVLIGAEALRILLVGFIFSAMAHLPYVEIQARGHSHITAAINAIELLPYMGMLYLMIDHFGIIGAAISWTVRMIVDFAFLKIAAIRLSRKEAFQP
ncbi:flippase [Aquitalea sp. LB_tupeE]|uniref:flippase n=1 Tax=Aquitalea sp. LB_tupeE TaxID=2748078 RepID=UPI0015B9864F|nr:flippase [Aquitalea sp. LB_tupeE]NWK78266.1 flippase [Aquitalea sp. LB_tupeE]